MMTNLRNRKNLLKRMPKNSICAEIGAWNGEFTTEIIAKTQPNKVFIIDPYKHVESYEGAWYGGEESSQEKMDAIYQSVRDRFESEIASRSIRHIERGFH